MKKPITLIILLCMLLWMTACGSKPSGQLETLPIETSSAERSDEVQDTEETAGPEQATEDETTEAGETVKEEQGSMLQIAREMMIVKETEVKNIMTKTNLPVSDYAVNPYVGCTHL
ncbi:MAG: hypothetical protein IJM01_02775 [Eubacterium sp.]|nr:hypothetical protein [Eubacterium sp.]